MAIVFGKDYPWYPVVGNHDIEKAGFIQFLRDINRADKSLPRIVRKGPAGCEETTYSFDWNDVHFIVLKLYYDGKSDTGADGNIVPELLDWMKKDLERNRKKYVFVFGHEPLLTIPDMDNGAILFNWSAIMATTAMFQGERERSWNPRRRRIKKLLKSLLDQYQRN